MITAKMSATTPATTTSIQGRNRARIWSSRTGSREAGDADGGTGASFFSPVAAGKSDALVGGGRIDPVAGVRKGVRLFMEGVDSTVGGLGVAAGVSFLGLFWVVLPNTS